MINPSCPLVHPTNKSKHGICRRELPRTDHYPFPGPCRSREQFGMHQKIKSGVVESTQSKRAPHLPSANTRWHGIQDVNISAVNLMEKTQSWAPDYNAFMNNQLTPMGRVDEVIQNPGARSAEIPVPSISLDIKKSQ